MASSSIIAAFLGSIDHLLPLSPTDTKGLDDLKRQLPEVLKSQEIEKALPGGLNLLDKYTIQRALLSAAEKGAAGAVFSPTPAGQEGGGGIGLQVFRREVPVVSGLSSASVPPWAAGMAIDHTIGPLKDSNGRLYWFDFYPVVQRVTVLFGTTATLQVPITGVLTAAQQYSLSAGSLWMLSQLLANTAPAGAFTGLKIKGGTIQFSQPVSVSGNSIVVAGGSCKLQVELDQPAAATSAAAAGRDAKQLVIHLPSQVSFICSGAAIHVDTASELSQKLYGQPYQYAFTPQPVTYEPALSQLLVPYQANVNTFAVAGAAANLFAPKGQAPIRASAWGLPVTVASIAQLGEAEGIGSIVMAIGKGITAQWNGLERMPAQLNNSFVVTKPGEIAIVAAAATGGSSRQQFVLWNQTPTVASTITADYSQAFALLYICAGSGAEVVFLNQVGIDAALDRPLDASGEPPVIDIVSGAIQLIDLADQGYVAIEATNIVAQWLEANPGQPISPVPLALCNAFIETTPVNVFLLFAKWDGGRQLTNGLVLLDSLVYYLFPILPDPYVTNMPAPLSIGRRVAGAANNSRAVAGVAGSANAVLEFITFVTWQTTQVTDTVYVLVPGNGASALLNTSTGGVGAQEVLRSDALRGLFNETLAVENEQYYLLDVSTNSDWFGVGVAIGTLRTTANSVFPLFIDGINLVTAAHNTRIYTLPQVQWEPLQTIPNPAVTPAFPLFTGSDDTGLPTIVGTESYQLVPIAPRPVIRTFVDQYNAATPQSLAMLFSLPFGMNAAAILDNPNDPTQQGATFGYNQPVFTTPQNLEGGLQLSVIATSPDSGAQAESPHLKGATIQTRNLIDWATGLPAMGNGQQLSALGPDVDTIFNNELNPGGVNPRVPLERMDLGGYGASIFSNWLNPAAKIAATSQVEFDVLRGRTAHEVVQVKSLLYPWAVPVVRTITIQRTSGGGVTRYDSGWIAQGPGIYDFSYTDEMGTHHNNPFEFHAGVVHGVYNVKEISDTGQIYTAGTVEMAEVFFNADVLVEDVVSGASNGYLPSAGQRGFVQLAPSGTPLTPQQFCTFLDQEDGLGGPVDGIINVGNSGELMRVTSVKVNGIAYNGQNFFVSAGYGSLRLPGESSWSLVQRDTTGNIVPLDPDAGLPVIRENSTRRHLGFHPVTINYPYRFADPIDLKNASAPLTDYGLLQSAGSEKVLFLRPVINAGDANIKSDLPPYFADCYAISLSKSIFPAVNETFPLGSGGTNLAIQGAGQLQLTSGGGYTAPAGYTRDLLNNGGSRVYINYSDVVDGAGNTQVNYQFDSTAAIPWQANMQNHSIVIDLMSFKSLVSVSSSFQVQSGAAPQMTQPLVKFGPDLQPLIDLLSFFGGSSMAAPMLISMTNTSTWTFVPKVTGGLTATLTFEAAAVPYIQIKVGNAVLFTTGVEVPAAALKITVTLKVGFYVNIPGKKLTSGAASTDTPASIGGLLNFEGDLAILCATVGVASVYFLGSIVLNLATDSVAGNSLVFQALVGAEVDSTWPVVGKVTVSLQVGFEMDASTTAGTGYYAIMLLKSNVSLLAGLIAIAISIEAKGGQKEVGGHAFAICEVDFALNVSVVFIINISFTTSWQQSQQVN
ncbi:MAG TPA: hypothetical protein VGS79_28070 [Puia sp.]|nr:hypothetical protein [Puia sp.]